MLNYQVDPGLLNRYVPPATSLDSFDGKTYVSLVGFRFCRTKLFGYFPVPFHANFDEVNLRFYACRKNGGDIRRGVVFIAEIVPRRAIATAARWIYGENYKSAPMKHRIETDGASKTAQFQWQVRGQWCRLSAKTEGPSAPPPLGTRNNSSPNITGVIRLNQVVGASNIMSRMPHGKYGQRLTQASKGTPPLSTGANSQPFLKQRPDCAFMAGGSPVIVHQGNSIL